MRDFLRTVWEKAKTVGGRIGKRNLVLIACVFALGAVVYLNFRLFTAPDGTVAYGTSNMKDNVSVTDVSAKEKEENGDAAEYFASTVLNRQKARDEAIEVLRTVVSSESALETAKEQALGDIERIAADIAKEADIETLVCSKGFESCIAVISGDVVNVIVKSSGLLLSEVAQINEIVLEQTGTKPENVKIIEKSA
ncbi:MAG: SpoIIIAH-like family protein [Clostridia bacterium]|nr:SpoIIIAH-like family protein [Clostridia bacterium]